MATRGKNLGEGIRLVLEEMREDRLRADDYRRKADEDRRKADEDRRKADEDRRKADEDRRRIQVQFKALLTRLDGHIAEQKKRDEDLSRLIRVLGDVGRTLIKKQDQSLAKQDEALVKQDESLGILKQIAKGVRVRGNGHRGNGSNGGSKK